MMDFQTILLAVLVIPFIASAAEKKENEYIVQTQNGILSGTHDGTSRDGRAFYQFRGIQYAVVEERFKPSVEPKPWNGTKEAKSFGPGCNNIDVHGNENCLYLNVYTPVLGSPNTTLLPVAIYIHGGSFQYGAGDNYGPNYLMDENIVFVTINYRLGILGFMSTEDESSPGNYGLKDQVMALRWVQSNIHAFGGDNKKVTLFGQSAGSASVTYHLVSPMSKGLFQHAIAQSGTLLDPWAFSQKPLRYAIKLAQELKCPNTNNTAAIVECLKAVPATTISQNQLFKKVTIKFFEDPVAAFGPTIEPIIGNGANTFLSASPYQLLAEGNVNKVPLLSGVVKEEGIYIWAAFLLFHGNVKVVAERQKLQANFTAVAPGAFYFDEKAPSNRLGEISKMVENFYFGKDGFCLNKSDTFSQLAHLYSDRMYLASGVRFMNMYSKLAPTYPYLYTFNKFVGIEFEQVYGVEEVKELQRVHSLDSTHGSELDLIFKFKPSLNPARFGTLHDTLSKSVTKLWTSFIKDGAPTATYGSERSFPAIQSSVGLQKWYKLDEDTALVDNMFSKRIAFWESLQLSDDDFDNCYC